jgi:hypothetical protein
MAITGVPPQDVSDYPWSGGSSGPGAPPPPPPPPVTTWYWHWHTINNPDNCQANGELAVMFSCNPVLHTTLHWVPGAPASPPPLPIPNTSFPNSTFTTQDNGWQMPNLVFGDGSCILISPCPSPTVFPCLGVLGASYNGILEVEFSMQDSNGNFVPQNATLNSPGGSVLQFGQGWVITDISTPTSPHHYKGVFQGSIFGTLPERFMIYQDLVSDVYTFNFDSITEYPNGVGSTGVNHTINNSSDSLFLEEDPLSPCPSPSWYCTDWNCMEIMYPPATYWTTGSGQMFFQSILAEIYGCIGQPPLPLFPCPPPPVPTGGFSQSQLITLGGAWYGFTTLAQMAATPGVMTLPPTASQSHSTWVPLHHNLDDCINCCGGINIPTYSNGTPNPYYGEYSTHPTMVPANQNAGFAAHLLLNPSAYMGSYLATQGVTMCGAGWGI